jgi:ElaA protein
MELKWSLARFEALARADLYDLLRLRCEVFIVEQKCPYLDPDGKDCHPEAWHLLGRDETGELVAYLRLLPPDLSYEGAASLGRVVTSPRHRGKGLGDLLMLQALREVAWLWPDDPVRIGAQAHLTAFYGKHGFVVDSDEYDEDGIPHREMQRAASPPRLLQ